LPALAIDAQPPEGAPQASQRVLNSPPIWHEDVAIGNHYRLLNVITHWTFISGVVICLIGAYFIRLGATGTTKVTLFGQTLESTNVGIAAVFIGAVLIVRNVRRILKVIESASKRRSA